MKSELHYLGVTVAPTKVFYEFYRHIDGKGKPSTGVLGGAVTVELPTSEQTLRFLTEMLAIDERCKNYDLPMPTPSECYKKVVLKIYDEQQHPIRTLELLDTHIASFSDVFTAVQEGVERNETNHGVTLTFRSASQIINKGVTKNVFGWWITDPFTVDPYSTPVYRARQTKDPTLVKGVWTSEREGAKVITKANLEDTVYFQITTKDIADGEQLHLRLSEYDYTLGIDNLDPDDHEFPEREVKKTVTVQNNQARLRLYLDPAWAASIQKDHTGTLRLDRTIELYWEVRYQHQKRELPEQEDGYLKVGYSKRTLYFDCPFLDHPFPELFSYHGDPMFIVEFGKGFIAEQLIEKGIKAADQEAGKAIKRIALAKLEKGYLADHTGKVYTGKRLLYKYKELYTNSGEVLKDVIKGKNFGYRKNGQLISTKGVSQYDFFAKKGKRVTLLSAAKHLGFVFDLFDVVQMTKDGVDTSEPLAFPGPLGLISDLTGMILKEHQRQEDFILNRYAREEMDMSKLKGLEATKRALRRCNNLVKFEWGLLPISSKTAHKLLKGEFENLKELYEFNTKKDLSNNLSKILYREIYNEDEDRYIYIIESIFIDE